MPSFIFWNEAKKLPFMNEQLVSCSLSLEMWGVWVKLLVWNVIHLTNIVSYKSVFALRLLTKAQWLLFQNRRSGCVSLPMPLGAWPSVSGARSLSIWIPWPCLGKAWSSQSHTFLFCSWLLQRSLWETAAWSIATVLFHKSVTQDISTLSYWVPSINYTESSFLECTCSLLSDKRPSSVHIFAFGLQGAWSHVQAQL